MSLGRTMTWQETAAVFYYTALLQTRQDTRRNLRHKRSLLCPIGHNSAKPSLLQSDDITTFLPVLAQPHTQRLQRRRPVPPRFAWW